jgi:hypothetical protein
MLLITLHNHKLKQKETSKNQTRDEQNAAKLRAKINKQAKNTEPLSPNENELDSGH